MKDDALTTREKKIARLTEQWQRSVRAAIQGSRKDKGLTQEDAAARMAWTQDIVSNIEAGRRHIFVAEMIDKHLFKLIGINEGEMNRNRVSGAPDSLKSSPTIRKSPNPFMPSSSKDDMEV